MWCGTEARCWCLEAVFRGLLTDSEEEEDNQQENGGGTRRSVTPLQPSRLIARCGTQLSGCWWKRNTHTLRQKERERESTSGGKDRRVWTHWWAFSKKTPGDVTWHFTYEYKLIYWPRKQRQYTSSSRWQANRLFKLPISTSWKTTAPQSYIVFFFFVIYLRNVSILLWWVGNSFFKPLHNLYK